MDGWLMGLDLYVFVKRRVPAVGADRDRMTKQNASTHNKAGKDGVLTDPEEEAGIHTVVCNHQTSAAVPISTPDLHTGTQNK